MEKICSECGVIFNCGSNENIYNCWCTNYPPLLFVKPENDCLCPQCLKKKVEAQTVNIDK